MKKPYWMALSLLLSVAAFAQQCPDYSGTYRMIPSTEKSDSCTPTDTPTDPSMVPNAADQDCFAFPASELTITQNGCDSVQMHVAGAMDTQDTTMSFVNGGSAIQGTARVLVSDYTTTLTMSPQNPGVLSMDYQQQSTIFGFIKTGPYHFTAQFQKE